MMKSSGRPPAGRHVAVIALIAAWFAVCNVFNISSKLLSSSNSHSEPSGALWNAYVTTTAQLLFTSMLGSLLLTWQRRGSVRRVWAVYQTPAKRMALPGVALALANLSMHWALTRTSVGMFQTAKSASPFFTAFACHFVLQRRYTLKTYLSLLPIVIGLGFASVTDLEFEPLGTLACFFSAMCQVFVNLSLKSVLETCLVPVADATATSPPQAETLGEDDDAGRRALFAYEVQSLVSLCGLGTLVVVGSVLSAPSWLSAASSFSSPIAHDGDVPFSWTLNLNRFLLFNVVLYASESVLAYSVNARLSRLPYAVVDAVRRLSIVVMSNVFFHSHRALDATRSLNLLAVLAVATGAIIFAFVVQEEPQPASL